MAETMLDKVKEIENLLRELNKQYPEATSSFLRFLTKVIKERALTSKEKELISLALGIATGCEWCIALHTKNAIEAGATPEQLIEAGFVAVLMAGGPALMHLIPLMDAINQFYRKDNEK